MTHSPFVSKHPVAEPNEPIRTPDASCPGRGSLIGRANGGRDRDGGELAAATGTTLSANRGGVAMLLVAVLALRVGWGVLLPALGRWQRIRNHVDAMERQQINVGAMFYTELNESDRYRQWLFEPTP